jgi:tRNA threonylcarbamoyladenosine biosynthesis protein TsaB
MMVILAVDTSHPVGSVALNVDGQPAGWARFGDASSHLVELGGCVDRLLRDSGLRVGEVSRIALVEGPGSFTGLRVGMAYVKGLAAALDLDVVTTGTLELLAMPLLDRAETRIICPMVDAHKSEVYAAVYGSGKELMRPCVVPPKLFLESAQKFDPLFVGSGAIRYRQLIDQTAGPGRIAPETASLPSTQYLAGIARDLEPLPPDALRTLEPMYLRRSDAELKRLKPIDSHG